MCNSVRGESLFIDIDSRRIGRCKEETNRNPGKSIPCHVCGKATNKKHGKDKERKVKHLPMIENDVFIIYQPNRYICDDYDNHPATTVMPSWYTKHSAFTNAYE